MRKVILALIGITALIALTGCNDFTDKKGNLFQEYKPFFDYTFENNYMVESNTVSKFNPISNTKNTEYKIKYKDNNGVDRELIFHTMSTTTRYILLKDVEKNIEEILEYDFDENHIKTLIDEEYRVGVQLLEHRSGEGKADLYSLIDAEYGPKLSNIYEFIRGHGVDIYSGMYIKIIFKNPEDKIKFEQNEELVNSVKDAIDEATGRQYEIEIVAVEDLS